jgi:hypothetical protein
MAEKTSQRNLFDPAPPDDELPVGAPYQSHSSTSQAAAEAILPKAGTLRRKVLDYLVGRGVHGATDEEIQGGLQMGANTERPRRIELVNALLVRDSGTTRPTRSGKQAVVWAVEGVTDG